MDFWPHNTIRRNFGKKKQDGEDKLKKQILKNQKSNQTARKSAGIIEILK
jgi:uncharacterized membrane protein